MLDDLVTWSNDVYAALVGIAVAGLVVLWIGRTFGWWKT